MGLFMAIIKISGVFLLIMLIISFSGCSNYSETPVYSSSPVVSTTPVITQSSPTIEVKPNSKDPWEEMVLRADCIVAGTITNKSYELVTVPQTDGNGKLAYTNYILSVEKVIKGDTDTKEIFIKLQGGPINENLYEVPVFGGFEVLEKVLVCLSYQGDNRFTLVPDGKLWTNDKKFVPSKIEDAISHVTRIMNDKNIPKKN
jgi:hypothetical protein